MSSSDIYTKYTPLEHILERPDTYIGTTDVTENENIWLLSNDKTKMEKRNNYHYEWLLPSGRK